MRGDVENEERAATGEEVGRGGIKVKREKTEIDGGKRQRERLCVLGLDHNLEARC